MSEQDWDIVIDTQKEKGRASFQTIWSYRDLLWLLVRRDFVSFYKQTILGPIWIFIQPIFSTIVYIFIFGNLAGLSTDGIPQILFYMSGVTVWSYFTTIVSTTSSVLLANTGIFGKVYFPRLIMPLSILFSSLIKFGIQLTLILLLFIYFIIFTDEITMNVSLLLAPIIIVIVGLQAMGIGLLVTAISTKYRDISMLIGYVLQLGLFITPIVYPLSSISGIYKILITANPMTIPVELFRFSMFGSGSFTFLGIVYMVVVTMAIALIGLYAFNKTEKTFIDTV